MPLWDRTAGRIRPKDIRLRVSALSEAIECPRLYNLIGRGGRSPRGQSSGAAIRILCVIQVIRGLDKPAQIVSN
jgi:hypothetical protein